MKAIYTSPEAQLISFVSEEKLANGNFDMDFDILLGGVGSSSGNLSADDPIDVPSVG